MKKLLSLLSVLTINGTAVTTTIAASPYKKEENKLENKETNYQQINNLKNLIRNKREENYKNDIEHSAWDGKMYASFRPEFWEEIENLKLESTDYEFKSKVSDKLSNNVSMPWYLKNGYTFDIARCLLKNFDTISNKFTESNKRQRIRIIATLESPICSFKSVNIREDEPLLKNVYLNNLKNDFYDWDKTKINLGLLNDNNDDDIKNAIKEKYPNLITENIEVIDKKYSYFFNKDNSKSFGGFLAKIKISKNCQYSHGILKPILSYTTKTKFNEISNYIANNKNVKQWIEHLTDYNKNLPTKIEQLKTYNEIQKLSSKNTEKEILKSYIRDWNIISDLIEHELKLEELNNNIIGIKSNFENIKKEMNDLENRIMKLEEGNDCESNGYITSGTTGILSLFPIPVLQQISGIVSATSSAVAAYCGA